MQRGSQAHVPLKGRPPIGRCVTWVADGAARSPSHTACRVPLSSGPCVWGSVFSVAATQKAASFAQTQRRESYLVMKAEADMHSPSGPYSG